MWVLNQDHKGKLDPRSHKYKFIGLSDETHACWYYKPTNGEVAKLHNIIFPHSHPIPTFPIPIPSPPEGESGSIDGQSSQEDPDDTQETTDDDLETPDNKAELMPDNRAVGSFDDPIHSLPDNTPSNDNSSPIEQFPGIHTHTQLKKSNSSLVQIRSDHGPIQMEKQKSPSTMIMMAIDTDKPGVNDALNGPDSGHWRSVMDAEVAQLQNLDMFILVPLPADRKIISCQLVLTTKHNSDGEIIKYKAQLVAQGFSQIPGVDFDETFLLVMQLKSFQILLAIAIQFDLEIHQMDVVSAYLNGDLIEEIYMKQIPGYEDGSSIVL